MYLAGIKVPKLGSLQDRVFRDYMTKKVSREVSEVRLLAQIAVAQGGSDKYWAKTISDIWRDYVNGSYYLEAEKKTVEVDMISEYNKFRHLRPVLEVRKDGVLTVKGIPKSIS